MMILDLNNKIKPATTQFATFNNIGFEQFEWGLLTVILCRLSIAALFGAFVAYRWWRPLMSHQFDPTESNAQVLIAVVGALLVTIIGNNIALAFGLVGLGGFIRFRSGIKDPKEAGVMFLMIGIGMASGIGMMPLSVTATVFGAILLIILDFMEVKKRKMGREIGRKRLRFSDIADPQVMEPRIRTAIEKHSKVQGSKIKISSSEVVIDILANKINSAGNALLILNNAGIQLTGEVSCEEL